MLGASCAWAEVRPAWVIPETVNVRKGPGTDYEVVAQTTRGTKVFVVKFKGGWAGLKLPSGKWGWIREDLLQFSASKGQALAAATGNGSSSAPASSGTHPPAWVTVDNANVRSGPGLGYSRYGSLSRGTKLFILERRSGWLRCKTPGGVGWLSSVVVTSDVKEGQKLAGSAPDPPKVFVDSEVVNLRSSPNTSSNIIARLVEGQTAWVLATKGDWAKVRVQGGASGWVMRKYIKSPSQPESPGPAPGNFPSASGSRFKSLTAWVDEDGTNVREGPGTDRAVKFQLRKDQKITVVDLEDQWCKIQTSGGESGWIAGWVVSFTPPSSDAGPSDDAKLGWVTRPLINLRSGPGENYPRVGTLELSTQVFILAQKGDWYKVAMENKEIGWVGSWLIDTRGARSSSDPGTDPGQGPIPAVGSSGESGSHTGRAVVKTAMQQLGSPYVRGAEGPNSFDCSGLVQYCLGQHGISAARTSQGLFRQGHPVSRDNLEPGDVVFFANTYRAGISHVGFYIGGGRFIHAANPGSGVKITDLDDSYYASRYVGARRMY